MAHVLNAALLAVAAIEEVAVDGPAHHAREDVHHHAEAVALVAAEIARSAERRDEAVFQRDEGIGGGRAVCRRAPSPTGSACSTARRPRACRWAPSSAPCRA